MSEIVGPSAVRQEAQDISGKHAVWTGVGVIVIAMAAVGIMAWMLIGQRGSLRDSTAAPKPPGSTPLIERTRIEHTERGVELNREAQHRLDTWGWVERGKTAHIPIVRAIDWLLQDSEQGELSWPEQAAPRRITVPGESGETENAATPSVAQAPAADQPSKLPARGQPTPQEGKASGSATKSPAPSQARGEP